MFQLLVKFSLFFCLLVCANRSQRKVRTTNPTFVPDSKPSLSTPSQKDYEDLYNAITTEFAPDLRMKNFLRLSLYEILVTWVDPNGCSGPHYDYEGDSQTSETNILEIYLKYSEFKELDFSKRGNIYHVTRSLFITLF
jgi:hypothetical protein